LVVVSLVTTEVLDTVLVVMVAMVMDMLAAMVDTDIVLPSLALVPVATAVADHGAAGKHN